MTKHRISLTFLKNIAIFRRGTAVLVFTFFRISLAGDSAPGRTARPLVRKIFFFLFPLFFRTNGRAWRPGRRIPGLKNTPHTQKKNSAYFYVFVQEVIFRKRELLCRSDCVTRNFWKLFGAAYPRLAKSVKISLVHFIFNHILNKHCKM